MTTTTAAELAFSRTVPLRSGDHIVTSGSLVAVEQI
jgi:hypothetical protein